MPKLAANLSLLFPQIRLPRSLSPPPRAPDSAMSDTSFRMRGPRSRSPSAAGGRNRSRAAQRCPRATRRRAIAGIACLPERSERIPRGRGPRDRVCAARSLHAAQLSRRDRAAGMHRARSTSTRWSRNVKYAADRLKTAGIRLMIEPRQHAHRSGIFLTGSTPGDRSPRCRRLGQRAACNTTSSTCRSWKAISRARIERLLPRIGHMQLADVPDRHEPGNRRDQLRLPAAPHRPGRLRRLDRLRIQSEGRHGRRAWSGRSPTSSASEHRAAARRSLPRCASSCPSARVLWREEETRPYECDGLTAYRHAADGGRAARRPSSRCSAS